MTPPQSTISIDFINKLEDHIKAQQVLYGRGVFAKLDKAIALLLVGFGIYCVTFAGLYWWTMIWFPLAIAEWFNLLSLSRWRTKIEFQRNPKFREEYHLTFSLENIHFQTASIDSTLAWTHYERIVESPDLFLLMYGKGLYTLIPKRCFNSNEEINAFRALIDRAIVS
jgi:YcxB-like protein